MAKRKEAKAQKELLYRIAAEHNYSVEARGDLKYRMNDTEDFIEVSVGGLEAALEAAYEAGMQAAKQK